MIPVYSLAEWQQKVPWPENYQVEQDLIISRALVGLYKNPKIRENLIFRGGTALNKLYINPPARYSEDIDLVQITSAPIGTMIDEIRVVLSWLGEPVRKLTERGVKLIYRYLANDNSKMKLKIEINTTEHFHFLDLVEHKFTIDNSWFTGETMVRTYQLNELMGTKLRALYQRRKGRDLFDIWLVSKNNMVDHNIVLDVFLAHCEKADQKITRALFEKSLFEKAQHDDFRYDILELLADKNAWSFEGACEIVKSKFIDLLPGEPWKVKEKN